MAKQEQEQKATGEQLPAETPIKDQIKEKVVEKVAEGLEKIIAKLQEILGQLKPHPEPVVQDAALHIQTAIDKLKKSGEGK
jgi:actin-like ATPase involved in cell morphogenesis